LTTSSRTSRTRNGAILCAWILLAAISGCGKSNPVKPQIQQPISSSTPQNTLENLRRAYTSRDSTGYDSLFDASYAGTSIDPSGMSPVVLNFTKADESLHIRALVRSVSITRVKLQFPPTLTRFSDAADTVGWATIQTVGSVIEVDNNFTSLVVNPNETMVFKFRPTTPAAGSPTDTTWKIVRWSEIAP
jgi:hypothetical protein